MRNTFVKELFNLAKQDKDIILLTGDLGYNVLNDFWTQLPEQFINVGIAEENLLGLAAGLALSGKKPYIYSIANFPTLRALEFIRNDICYHNANVKIVCVGGGFAYGSAGFTHHATEDIAIMRALPNMIVATPGDLSETEYITETTYNIQQPTYIRLGRGGEKRFNSQITDLPLGSAIKQTDGNQIALFSCGAIMDEAMEAIQILKSQDKQITYYTFPTVKPLDTQTIKQIALSHKHIFTLEEGNVTGGLFGAVSEVVCQLPERTAQLHSLGLQDCFTCVVGSQKYLREHYGISAQKIADSIIQNTK